MTILSKHKTPMERQLQEGINIRMLEDEVDIVMNSKSDWMQPDLVRWICKNGNKDSEDKQRTILIIEIRLYTLICLLKTKTHNIKLNLYIILYIVTRLN